MQAHRETWKRRIADTLRELAREREIEASEIDEAEVIVERPPKPELGDLGFPLFPFARLFRMAPKLIAEATAARLQESGVTGGDRIETAGPYVNVSIDRVSYARGVFEAIEGEGDDYGRGDSRAGQRVMVEFSAPNTNKPLHLGHLRNDAIGESVARIVEASGAEVRKVNLVNDRGIHICKSMLAYREFGQGETPESAGEKPDKFVGDFYVKFADWAQTEPAAEARAREMLQQWESSEPDTLELWKTMNDWAVQGIQQTYRRTGISFDEIYYESQTYGAGREEVLKGLERGVFYTDEEGTVWVDLEDIDLDKKVLLRGDGTSLYLTQDIGTAIRRHADWPFDRLVYVVASEQRYHFTVLFHVLERLGFDWAGSLFHLAYGMVNLPEGKMKSREGTVVDADDLIDQLAELAAVEIREKERESQLDDIDQTAEAIALGALHYYLLAVNPMKDIVFDPAKSLSFNGNTGPYLQYTGARIRSIARKAETAVPGAADVDASALSSQDEWELVKLLGDFPSRVEDASREYNPSHVTAYLFELAKTFSRYYHEYPVLGAATPAARDARLLLAISTAQVLKNGFRLINIPFLESM
ncbi:MAG: arginine--tRNA ligase [Spirochaetes bacterium]|jgi:arginyl-tRNA synthetase|nr:arginine--tRNA ligase [Spirochaetota bacterium]